MYLLRVVVSEPDALLPKANMPLVEFPAAEPEYEAADADAAEVLVQVAKVYLLRVVEPVVGTCPKANMPLVELPAAEPYCEPQLAAPTPLAVLLQQA